MKETYTLFDFTLRKPETSWRKNGDWKARYSRLYSSRGITLPKKEEPHRISFMGNDTTPYATLLMKLRASRQECSTVSDDYAPSCLTSLMTAQSECYGTRQGSQQSENLVCHDTTLLDMVRARSREVEDEIQDQPLDLPHDETTEEYQNINDTCVHGFNVRTTERSVSRSRVSRISTRRDMDIPSILAFTTSTPAPVCLGIPAFQKVEQPQQQIPRWSIRRSVCPVCSQKWRDRSSIMNIKYSGLKRNSSLDLPSVIAPARIRTSNATGFIPRSVPAAEDMEAGLSHGGFRNSSASWQLTRARRFRIPRQQLPSPEATAPPSCSAPTARKDLDLRVSRFLSDEFRYS